MVGGLCCVLYCLFSLLEEYISWLKVPHTFCAENTRSVSSFSTFVTKARFCLQTRKQSCLLYTTHSVCPSFKNNTFSLYNQSALIFFKLNLLEKGFQEHFIQNVRGVSYNSL